MNVLLAEAQVPYEQLKEMDDINAEFKQADVVLVVGANDVVNPAAKTTPGAPIYGMPILNADEAQQVVFMKRSMRPGFAGIENELLFDPKTTLLFGDAKDTMGKLLSAVKATPSEARTRCVSDDAVQPVAGVAEARHDVALLVEPLVHAPRSRRVTGTSSPASSFSSRAQPSGAREQADRGDVVGAAVDQEPDRRRQRAAGRQHRVEHVALPPGQVVGQPLGVRRGLQRLLVAHHAEEPDLGRRQQPHHAVEHAEPGAQDRHDERLGACELDPFGVRHRASGRRTGVDAYVARRLVGQQRHQLVGEPPEGR